MDFHDPNPWELTILGVVTPSQTESHKSDLDNELADNGNLGKEARHGSHVQTIAARRDEALRDRLLGLVAVFSS